VQPATNLKEAIAPGLSAHLLAPSPCGPDNISRRDERPSHYRKRRRRQPGSDPLGCRCSLVGSGDQDDLASVAVGFEVGVRLGGIGEGVAAPDGQFKFSARNEISQLGQGGAVEVGGVGAGEAHAELLCGFVGDGDHPLRSAGQFDGVGEDARA
jgi:hypothetical protein